MSRIFVGYSSWFPFMFKIKHCAQHILIVEIMSGFAAWTQLPLLSLSLFVKVIKISLDFSPYFSFTFIISIALVKSKRTALLCHARHYTAQNWGQFFCPSCLQRQFVFPHLTLRFVQTLHPSIRRHVFSLRSTKGTYFLPWFTLFPCSLPFCWKQI